MGSCVWQRDFKSVNTGRLSGIACMSQGIGDQTSDLLRAMAVVKIYKRRDLRSKKSLFLIARSATHRQWEKG